jgi:recombination protein RecA
MAEDKVKAEKKGAHESKGLDEAIKALRKKYGDGALSTLQGEEEEIQHFSTGLPSLDAITGVGGIPRGKMIELYGRESAGKSLLACTIAMQAQKIGIVHYLDFENSLDPRYLKSIGVQLGTTFLVSKPTSMEDGFDMAMEMISSGQIVLTVMDSVGAMVTRDTLKRDAGEQKPGEVARILSVCLHTTLPELTKHGTTMMFINHLRSTINPYGPSETTSGGNALKYFLHMKLELKKKTLIQTSDGPVGIETLVKISKNKVGRPFGETLLRLMFDTGFDRVASVLDSLVKAGIVEASGGGAYKSELLGINVRGKDNVLALFQNDVELMDRALQVLVDVSKSTAEMQTRRVSFDADMQSEA